MTLKEYVKQHIMQYPGIFHNALLVYNHLFYVNGNGHEWHNGTLIEPDFKEKSVAECITDNIKFRHEILNNEIEFEEAELTHKIRHIMLMNFTNRIVEDIHTIMNAEKLANDFSIPTKRWPYNIEPFEFYPICEYAKCMNIPDNIDPEWKDAIDKLNKIKEEYEFKNKK